MILNNFYCFYKFNNSKIKYITIFYVLQIYYIFMFHTMDDFFLYNITNY